MERDTYILSLAVDRATKGWTLQWVTATSRERADAIQIIKRAGIKLPPYRKPAPVLIVPPSIEDIEALQYEAWRAQKEAERKKAEQDKS